jgi:hypothetical protein
MARKQLGQLRPADTTTAVLFSPDENKPYNIDSIFIANTGSGTIKVSIFHDEDGTTWDQTTALVWEKSIATDDYLHLIYTKGIAGRGKAGSLAVKTDSSDDATFTVYGYVEGETS